MISPPSNPSWPARLLSGAAAGAMIITLAYPSSSRQCTWPWVLFLTLVWLAPIVALLGTGSPWRRPDRLLASGLLLLALATFASAAFSPFAALSILRIWPALGGISLLFWLHHWLSNADGAGRATRLGSGLSWFGACIGVASIVHWRWQSAGSSFLTRNDFPFGHSNYTAGAMLLVLPWLVHAAWQSHGLRRFAWSLAGVAALLALVTTSSRAGVLALAATGGATLVVALLRTHWSRRAKSVMGFAAVAVLLLTIFANPRLRELAFSGGWGDLARESNTQHGAMLQAGLVLGATRPALGWGPGTVPLIYPQVRAQLDGGTDNVLELHSTPLQIWATLGSVGLLALLLLIAATIRQLFAVSRTLRQPAGTAAIALLAYGLFALIDHQLDLAALNVLLVVNLAIFFQGTGSATTFSSRTRHMLTLAVGAVLLIPLWLTSRDVAARLAYEHSLSAFEAGRENDGIARLETAANRAPYDPYYRHQLAGRLLAQRENTSYDAEREQLSAKAADQLRLSLATGCLQEYAHFNLAWLALESGALHLAAGQFRDTLALAPHRGGAYFGLGLALRYSQRENAAVRAFALEWINDPAAAVAPIWAHPDFAPFRKSIAREANAILGELAPTQPPATYILALWRWWEHSGPPPAHGFNRESDQFITALTAVEQGHPLSPTCQIYSWGELLQTWRRTPADFTKLLPNDPTFAASLARRAGRHPSPDVHGFLTAGPEGEPNLLLASRSARTGYGVLALHPAGPVLTDLYVKQTDRIVSAFASTVFPPKGWLPARELLSRLPPSAPNP